MIQIKELESIVIIILKIVEIDLAFLLIITVAKHIKLGLLIMLLVIVEELKDFEIFIIIHQAILAAVEAVVARLNIQLVKPKCNLWVEHIVDSALHY